MKKRIGIVLGAVVLAGSAAAQPLQGVVGHPENALVLTDPTKFAAGNYKIDTNHTTVLGRILHGKMSYYTFRFDKFDGSYTYDPAKPEATKVVVTIDPSTIDSNLPMFDKRLAGPEFLDSGKYNSIRFVSTAIKRSDVNHGTMTGNVTLHGVTEPITFAVTLNGGGPVGQRISMGFSATASLEVADFGIDIRTHALGDRVQIIIETEFASQDQKTDARQFQQLQAPAKP